MVYALEMLEVLHRVLRYMLEVVRRVLRYMLEAVGGEFCLLTALE